jgi:cytochrome P450
MPMLGGNSYICKDPRYAALIQRASSTLDFDAIVANVTPRMVGSNKNTTRIIAESDLVKRTHGIVNPPLAQQQIGSIVATQLEHFGDFINKVESGKEVELFHFITREITAATMRSFYGPRNPFAVDPSLIESFWEWETDVIPYMAGVLRSVFARKAQAGLERCVQGFEKYAAEGGYNDAYVLVQDRKALHKDIGISTHEHARLELGLCFGFNSNASIITFWVLNNIFSRPALLAEVRGEIEKNAMIAPGTISFPRLRDDCPLLNSIYKETMRETAHMMSARKVHEDTLIADTFLLRKGAVVQIAGGILHQDPTIWGPDVSSFNPRRFQNNWNGSKTDSDGKVSDEKSHQVHASAFRGFGGGSSLCPGRFIAQMEIISLTAAVVCAFEMVTPQGKHEVEWNPPKNDKKFPFAVMKPLRKLDVQLKRREGLENMHWTLQA